jgi:hypothetical protein
MVDYSHDVQQSINQSINQVPITWLKNDDIITGNN